MTVIPYARFLEALERRQHVMAELVRDATHTVSRHAGRRTSKATLAMAEDSERSFADITTVAAVHLLPIDI